MMNKKMRRKSMTRSGLGVAGLCFSLLAMTTGVSRVCGEDSANPLKQLFDQGVAAEKANNDDAALAAFNKALELNPKLVPALYMRASLYEKKGEHAKAIADLTQVIALNPNVEPAYNNLAWILATCAQADLRDGKKAVELATKACDITLWSRRAELDSLAAACAEAGDFDNAVKWQKQMIATPGISPEALQGANERLALYQAQKPYHETGGAK